MRDPRLTRAIIAAVAAIAVVAFMGSCSSGGARSAARSGPRLLTEFIEGISGAARGTPDELSSGMRSQVDDLLADAAVVAARNEELAAIRSTTNGDEAYRAMCNITVDFVYPSFDDPSDPATDEISAAAVKFASAAYSELPAGAATAWADRIKNLGELAFGEPDAKRVAEVKLARDAAVYGFQLTYCR